MIANTLSQAYTHCEQIAQSHYENFPVASFLLPKPLRRPISVIYAFARSADDIADEGDLSPQERYHLLTDYHQQLERIQQGQASANPIFIALSHVIRQYKLPIQLFHDLLSAFEQDIETTSYQTFAQVMDYCRRSANPVGRLLLHLNHQASKENLSYSDHICSGLQLINFLQDIRQDYDENHRSYIPLEDLMAQDIEREELFDWIKADKPIQGKIKQLFQQQLQQTRAIYTVGKPLTTNLSGRFRFEIKAIYLGGLSILDKLESIQYFSDRPRLTKKDKASLFFRCFF